VGVRRRAKRVIVELDGPVSLVFRLGMTGRLFVVDSEAHVEKHTHLRIAIEGTGRELRFRDPRRFGGVWCVASGDGDRSDAKLGVEPLDATPAQFRTVLARRRQIKALLMDQSAIAGLGNIYCDESLHAARIHPLSRADRLDAEAVGRLLRAIKTILRRAIRFNGSTLMDYRDADGREGSFQKLHRVYQREGDPCRTCRTPIRRILAAGRSTFYCPQCQPKRGRGRTGHRRRGGGHA
jgi:formamidopyrimidine-DNA glycosylase